MRAELRALRRRWSLAVPAGALVVAIGMQGAPKFHSRSGTRPPHLQREVSIDVPGWAGRDAPLGANDFLSGEAKSVLNFDDVVNREYTRGADFFGVYVAYWGPGKMPTRMVASHTPDRCWTENGWHCVAMKFRQTESIQGRPLLPAEWRQFEPPDGGAPTYVLYWHLVDGRLYDYGRRFNAIPDPWLWWKDVLQQALRGDREQYFIRLTSNRPLESLWSDPGFTAVLRDLGRLGLETRPGNSSS